MIPFVPPPDGSEPQFTVQLTPSSSLSLETIAMKLIVPLTGREVTAGIGAPEKSTNWIGLMAGAAELTQPASNERRSARPE
jgi:hypothetical protein